VGHEEVCVFPVYQIAASSADASQPTADDLPRADRVLEYILPLIEMAAI
jgi:hypothetical protein